MLRREGQDIAFASDGLGLEEEGCYIVLRGVRLVFLLLFFDGAIVIDENESVLILRVRITLRAFIAGAEIALLMCQGCLVVFQGLEHD